MSGLSTYPAWKILLRVRLEDFSEDGDPKRIPNKLPQTQLKGVNKERVLVPQQITTSTGVIQHVLLPKGASVSTGGQIVGGPVDQTSKDTYEIITVPYHVELGRTGIAKAATLKFSVRFVDLPVDPRCVRVAGVLFYLGTIKDIEFADGSEGAYIFGNARQALLLPPEEWTDEHGNRRSNLRFKGWVDKWTVTWADDDEAQVDLECRDNTSILMEQILPPQLALGDLQTVPLDEAVANLLAVFPQFAGLRVEYRPNNQRPPSLKDAFANTAFVPNLGPTPAKDGGQSGASSKMSVWDYLTDVCGALGHVLFMDDDTVVIQQVRTLTSSNITARDNDPFRSRVVARSLADVARGNVDVINQRRLVYGHNLAEMTITRAYNTKNTPHNVEVRSYNPKTKQPLVVRFPSEPSKRIDSPGLGGPENADNKWTVIRVSGITDKARLAIVAQSYYESVSRNEISVNLTTNDLASFAGDNSDPDLLDLMPGDPLDVLVRRDDPHGGEMASFAELENAMLDESIAFQFLHKRLGFPADFARAYAQTYAKGGFLTTFRTRSVGISCDSESGVSFQIACINYVTIRADKFLSANTPGDVAGPAGDNAGQQRQTGSNDTTIQATGKNETVNAAAIKQALDALHFNVVDTAKGQERVLAVIQTLPTPKGPVEVPIDIFKK